MSYAPKKLSRKEIDTNIIQQSPSTLKTSCKSLDELGISDYSTVRKTNLFPQPNYKKMLNNGIFLDDIIKIKIMYDNLPSFPSCFSHVDIYDVYETYANAMLQAKEIISNNHPDECNAKLIDMYKNVTGYTTDTLNEHQKSELSRRWFSCMEKAEEASYCPFVYQNNEKNRRKKYSLIDNRINWIVETVDKRKLKAPKNESEDEHGKYPEFISHVSFRDYEGKKHAFYKGLRITPEDGCDTIEDTFTLLQNQYKDIMKGNFGSNFLDMNPREGVARRSKDITEDDILNEFNIHRIEFSKNIGKKDKQKALNAIWDALCDLSEIVGYEHKEIGYNKSLSISYGTNNGRDSTASVSSIRMPDNRYGIMLSLSDRHYPGGLAHEYYHVMDIMASRWFRSNNNQMIGISDLRANDKIQRDGKNPAYDMMDSTHGILNYLGYNNETDTPYFKQIKASIKENKASLLQYMLSPKELTARAFEVYVRDKIKEKGIKNPFLVGNKVTLEYANPFYVPKENMDILSPMMEDNIELLTNFDKRVIDFYRSEKEKQDQKENKKTEQMEMCL